MKKIKLFSFFAGCGFLDLGFELNGYDIELVNEFSPTFLQAYQYSRSKMNLHQPKYGYYQGDINDYLHEKADELKDYVKDAREDGSVIGFIGSPPCPDFSVAGKQKGKEGENGKLSLSYIQLVLEQQPDFFLFENVKGLWRTKKHRDFYEELKEMLTAGGYYLTDRLTNAREFLTPQDRDRILLFGINSKKFPQEAIHRFNWTKYASFTPYYISQIPWPTVDDFHIDGELACPDGVPKELTVEYWFRKNDVEHHPNGKDCFAPRAGISKMVAIQEGDDCKKSYKRLHRWRYSPTVAYGNNEVHLHPYKARRLTVAEALALQSLPTEFALPPEMSLTDKFKTVGNGVPYLLAAGVARSIHDFVGEEYHG